MLGSLCHTVQAQLSPSNAGAEGFLKQVLAAIAAKKDQQGLERLSVTEAEFKQCVWPSIPAHASAGQSVAKYFQSYSVASKVGIADRFSELAGQNLELVKASFGPEKRQKGCRLLPNPTITVRPPADRTRRIRSPLG
jgi:hypothetical protein